jgi:hypothetical protein
MPTIAVLPLTFYQDTVNTGLSVSSVAQTGTI